MGVLFEIYVDIKDFFLFECIFFYFYYIQIVAADVLLKFQKERFLNFELIEWDSHKIN